MDTAEDTPDTAKATERLMLSTDCEFVTFMSVVKGKFELTTSYCYFFDTSPYKVSCQFFFVIDVSDVKAKVLIVQLDSLQACFGHFTKSLEGKKSPNRKTLEFCAKN